MTAFSEILSPQALEVTFSVRLVQWVMTLHRTENLRKLKNLRKLDENVIYKLKFFKHSYEIILLQLVGQQSFLWHQIFTEIIPCCYLSCTHKLREEPSLPFPSFTLCPDPTPCTSVFLVGGAGTGKTRTSYYSLGELLHSKEFYTT